MGIDDCPAANSDDWGVATDDIPVAGKSGQRGLEAELGKALVTRLEFGLTEQNDPREGLGRSEVEMDPGA